MAQAKSYQAYQNTSVKTANQKKLIIMLYDGINRFLSQAVYSIEKGEMEAAHKQLTKVGKILLELTSTLKEDKGGDIAQNLKKLYVYSYERVVMANLKKDVGMIKDVQKVLNNLREGWASVAEGDLQKQTQKAFTGQLSVTG